MYNNDNSELIWDSSADKRGLKLNGKTHVREQLGGGGVHSHNDDRMTSQHVEGHLHAHSHTTDTATSGTVVGGFLDTQTVGMCESGTQPPRSSGDAAAANSLQ